MFLSQEDPFVMGILNITPDSFYDGGKYFDPEEALKIALKMQETGADLIDVGGESTRPGSCSVGVEEEIKRVLPIVELFQNQIQLPLSLDTSKHQVVQEVLKVSPIAIVNDVTALQGDEAMAKTVADSAAHVVLMHMQGTPQTMQVDPNYGDVISELISFFQERIQYACSKGIQREKIMIDPGIGFGKKLEHNLEILNRLSELKALECPILVGPSRKSFIGHLLGNMEKDRIWGTAASVAISIMNGASGVRVHDVEAMSQVVAVASKIKHSSLEKSMRK